MPKPFILSIVGWSDSGKTTLILKLLPELKKKGYNVAVAKYCPCGFDLDHEGKDSWKFCQAGSKGIFLSSPNSLALIKPKEEKESVKQKLRNYFSDFDIVLMESYNNEPEIPTMQIIRKGIGGDVLKDKNFVVYVSDMELDVDKPIYDLNDISGIVKFIEKNAKKKGA